MSTHVSCEIRVYKEGFWLCIVFFSSCNLLYSIRSINSSSSNRQRSSSVCSSRHSSRRRLLVPVRHSSCRCLLIPAPVMSTFAHPSTRQVDVCSSLPCSPWPIPLHLPRSRSRSRFRFEPSEYLRTSCPRPPPLHYQSQEGFGCLDFHRGSFDALVLQGVGSKSYFMSEVSTSTYVTCMSMSRSMSMRMSMSMSMSTHVYKEGLLLCCLFFFLSPHATSKLLSYLYNWLSCYPWRPLNTHGRLRMRQFLCCGEHARQPCSLP